MDCKSGEIIFTFHNVSINTGILQSTDIYGLTIYIPQCFY